MSAPPTRTISIRHGRIAACAIVALLAVGVLFAALGGDTRLAAAIDIECGEPADGPALTVVRERELRADDPMVRYPIPNVGGTPLPTLYRSLVSWVHPVIGAERTLPLLPTGHFGAERGGVLRVTCGDGHCGADLDGPRGRPIVAVASGVVVEIDRSRNGKDGRSGRYVRIEHDDGVVTSYMHLDTVERALDKGDRIGGGELLGTLGATGVQAANPHLHYSLEVPRIPSARGRRARLRYFDPAPFLLRATVSGREDGIKI